MIPVTIETHGGGPPDGLSGSLTGGAARGRRFGLDGRLGRGSGLFACHPVPSPTHAPVRVAIRFNTSNFSHICHRIKCRPASAMPRQRPTPAFRLVQYREEHTALFLGEAGMLFSY
jgi:hypothetical protein